MGVTQTNLTIFDTISLYMFKAVCEGSLKFVFFQAHIVRWLLNHDPSQRPTAQELLASDYLPPPQMEEAELNEVLR